MDKSSTVQPRYVRVVHVAQSIAGGVASFLEEIEQHQTALFGLDGVHFVVPAGSEAHLPRINPAQLIPFTSTARTPAGLFGFTRAAAAAIRRLRPDVVHLHSSYAGALVRPLLRSDQRPGVVYCPHGWAFAMETPAMKKRVYAAVERVLAARTDMIVVNSETERDVALHFGLPADKIRVVRNGISWAPLPERTAAEGPIRVGFIGRHDRQKGVDILLDVIRRFPFPHLQFEIIGASVLQNGHSGTGGTPANVSFHGWMSRAKTLDILNSFDAVVMPSRWDAAPIVAIEAMRAGVPVIASNRGALPEIIQHGVGGYIFDLEDPVALGATLQALDRSVLMRLGRTARARWEREYVADRMNALTCQIYGQLMQKRNPGPGQTGRAASSEPQETSAHNAVPRANTMNSLRR
jgi:glycosyltransferase involved in cell wall biosynthesis